MPNAPHQATPIEGGGFDMLVLSTKLNCQPIDAVNTTESPLVVNSRFIHNNLTGGFMR